MDDLLTGVLTPDNEERYSEFEVNVANFKSIVKDMVEAHKAERYKRE